MRFYCAAAAARFVERLMSSADDWLEPYRWRALARVPHFFFLYAMTNMKNIWGWLSNMYSDELWGGHFQSWTNWSRALAPLIGVKWRRTSSSSFYFHPKWAAFKSERRRRSNSFNLGPFNSPSFFFFHLKCSSGWYGISRRGALAVGIFWPDNGDYFFWMWQGTLVIFISFSCYLQPYACNFDR